MTTSRKCRPSSYARFKYPVKFHSSERRHSLTCDVPDCLRRPSSGVIWMMPVRQGPRRPTARSEGPSGAGGRTESSSKDNQDQSAVVIEVEPVSDDKEPTEQNQQVDAAAKDEESQDVTDGVEEYENDEAAEAEEEKESQADDAEEYDEDDDFDEDEDEDEHEEDNDSVTSTDDRCRLTAGINDWDNVT